MQVLETAVLCCAVSPILRYTCACTLQHAEHASRERGVIESTEAVPFLTQQQHSDVNIPNLILVNPAQHFLLLTRKQLLGLIHTRLCLVSDQPLTRVVISSGTTHHSQTESNAATTKIVCGQQAADVCCWEACSRFLHNNNRWPNSMHCCHVVLLAVHSCHTLSP